ncbi:MAG: HEAT repeat domain-containing protein [Candidatus Brocadiia bacterium]
MKYIFTLFAVLALFLSACSDTKPNIQQTNTDTLPLTSSHTSDLQWWGTAKAEIGRMLKDTNRTENDIEQPKWFESEYSTLGRMPLIDTALANPLLMPEIAMYFDGQCRKGSEGFQELFYTADEMANQSLREYDNCHIKEAGLPPEAAQIYEDMNKDSGLAGISGLLGGTMVAVFNAKTMCDSAFKKLTDDEKARAAKLLRQYFLAEKDGKTEFSAFTVESTDSNVELIHLMRNIDWSELLHAVHLITELMDDPEEISSVIKLEPLKGRPDILLDKETSIGRIIVGNTGNNTYTEDAAIIIDLGGDDTYLNNAGGTRPGKINAAIVIDVSGNDIYRGQDFCQGCGYLGVGALMDLQGNDTYIGRDFCQASALGGFGFLYDGVGDDTYTADLGGQSSAIFGYSILSERAGNDSYTCSMFGQAGAATMGVAILAEASGNDTYQGGGKYPFYGQTDAAVVQGAAIGMRPWPTPGRFTLYGGIALLSDASGDDRYSAQAFAQGGSYLFSLGMCVDSNGNDYYSGTDYVQGSACHLGAACMIDRADNDVYTATNHSTGGSLDRSAGVFLDIRGNDRYNSPEGVGYAGKPRGCGVFVDCLGDDRYEVGVYGRARYPYSENTQSSAFFLDMGGRDVYDANRPLGGELAWGDNKSWQQGEWGMARDWPAVPVKMNEAGWSPMGLLVLNYIRVMVEGYDKVMDDAELLSTFERFGVFDDIVNAGDKAVDIVASLSGSWNPFTQRDLIDIIETMRLKKLVKKGDNPELSGLLLSSKKDISLLGVTYFFRTINSQSKPDEEIIDALTERALEDESPEVRGIAALVLVKTGDVSLLPVIDKCLQDKDWTVRRRAVMALGYIKDRKTLDILINLFNTEKAHPVRAQIVSVMGRLGFPEAVPYIKKALEPVNGAYESDFTRYYAARALALGFKDKSGVDALIDLMGMQNLSIVEEITAILKELTEQDKAGLKEWWTANRDKFEFKK